MADYLLETKNIRVYFRSLAISFFIIFTLIFLFFFYLYLNSSDYFHSGHIIMILLYLVIVTFPIINLLSKSKRSTSNARSAFDSSVIYSIDNKSNQVVEQFKLSTFYALAIFKSRIYCVTSKDKLSSLVSLFDTFIKVEYSKSVPVVEISETAKAVSGGASLFLISNQIDSLDVLNLPFYCSKEDKLIFKDLISKLNFTESFDLSNKHLIVYVKSK